MSNLKYIFIIFSFITNASAQNPSKKIDSLIAIATEATEMQDFERSIIFGQKALKISLKNKNPEAVLKSYYRIAHSLSGLEMYKECLEIIADVKKTYGSDLMKHKKIDADFTNLLARNYLILGFKYQAIGMSLKELNLAKSLKPLSVSNAVKIRSYMMLAACYQSINKDSVKYYLDQARPLISDESGSEQSLFYYNLAHYYMYHAEDMNSAFHYNEIGLRKENSNSSKYKSFGLIQKGSILFKQKKYRASLKNCLEALPIVNEQKRLDYVSELYSLIASNYKVLGNNTEQASYLDKLVQIRDSVAILRKEAVEKASNILINTTTAPYEKNKKRTTILIAIIILVTLGMLTGIIVKSRNIKTRKNALLTLKEKQVNTLENKLQDNSYEQILSLARNNSADFLFRMQEHYPNFIAALLKVDSTLQTSELKFCCYLKLMFSTKEIATYTFVTPKSVQNRKNRLRKKLNITSEEDIYIWINKLD